MLVKDKAKKKRLARKEISGSTSPKKKKEAGKGLSKSYNKFKEYEGQRYTGMKVGRSHKWYYDQGDGKNGRSHPTSGSLPMLLPSEGQGKLRKVPCSRGY